MGESRKSRRSRPIFVVIVCTVVVVLSTTSLAGCGQVAAGPAGGSATDNGSPGADNAYSTVTLETEDGLVLGGREYGSSVNPAGGQTAGWVILCHMYPADQTSWNEEALRLAERGYSVLTFDFRGYGSSEGEKDIQYLDRDVTAAVRYAQTSGAQEVVLAGASMGGTAALVAAVELQTLSSFRVAGIATFSAPVEFNGLSARNAAASIVIPLLLVATEGDSGADSARELYSLSGERGELHVVPGSEHGTDIFAGAQAEAVRQLFYDFLQNCMAD